MLADFVLHTNKNQSIMVGMESNLVRFGIQGIAFGLAVLLLLGVRQAERAGGSEPALVRRRRFLAGLGVTCWMGLIALAAASGVLARFDLRPPPMVLWFVTVLGSAVLVGVSSWGKRLAAGLPFAALVGF